jgi:hypothetical protein
MNKLAINLASAFVDNQYFQVLIVPQAVVAKILRHLLAVFDRIRIGVELNADTVSIRDAVLHIEKESLHCQCPLIWDSTIGALRLQPRLCHRNFDNVLLNPFAMQAGERSQVLTGLARFNRGQPHGTAATCALRTLVLQVEHIRCSSPLVFSSAS